MILRGWARELRRQPQHPVRAWKSAQYWDVADEIRTEPAVCVEHMRAVPCRAQDGCIVSEQPEDVLFVYEHQRGRE